MTHALALVAALTLGGAARQRRRAGAPTGVAQAPAASPCGSTIRRAVVARGVEAREPVGTESPFPASGQPLYVFMEVNNPDTELVLEVRWFHDASGHQFGQRVTAGVSPRWRTWVRHRVQPTQAGDWRVEVRTPGGCLAAALTFAAE